MPWNVSAPAALPIIETRYEGVLAPSELADAVRETLVLARSSGRMLFLGDCRAMTGGHSVVDLYSLAEVLLSSGMGRGLKEAVVLPSLPESAESVRFWETACLNRGLRVRIFLDRESALAWLLE